MEQRKTNCHFCGYLCGFIADVQDGRIVGLTPDPERYPYDEQVLAGCQRWRMNLDVLDARESGGAASGSAYPGTRLWMR